MPDYTREAWKVAIVSYGLAMMLGWVLGLASGFLLWGPR